MGNVTETNKDGFMTKVKNGLMKFIKGIKNFVVKTGRVNGTHCYGIIDNIGDLIVYDDHALISAVGMDDIVFTKENVLSYSFEGLGKIRRNKATLKYKIVLDDNVVFPEKVREKNDVKNLIALVNAEKDRSHYLGKGSIEYGKASRGLSPVVECDVYGFGDCLVVVVLLEKRVGEKVEKYQESLLYPLSKLSSIVEGKNKSFAIKFDDDKLLQVTPAGDSAYETLKNIK
jgi:hypothetical protein